MKKIITIIIPLFAALFCVEPVLNASYCQKCCANHRFASEECLANCNQCQQYDDGGAAEGRDYPY